MNVVIYVLAFIGAWFLLAVVGGFIFGVFARGARAEDEATSAPLSSNVRVLRDQDAS